MKKFAVRFCAVALVATAMPFALFADGMRNPPDGATSLGRIGGTIAQIDDASTASRNPANMTGITNDEYSISLTGGYGTKKFTRPDAVAAAGAGGSFDTTAKSKNNLSGLPDVYVVMPFQNSDGLVGGFAITTPFGRSTTWDQDSLFRYTAPYFSQIMAVNFNPSVAMKINDRISVAVGVDVLWSSLDIKEALPWSQVTKNPSDPDGGVEFDGEGVGFGGNAAINFIVTTNQKLSLTYRSAIDTHYSGTTHVAAIPQDAGMLGVTPTSGFSTDISFPAVAGLGYGIELTDTIRVEADVEWVQHSVFDDLTINAENNTVLLPSSTVPANWKDTWTYGIGADWKFAPEWTARTGWMHLDTPIPQQTLIPSVAEENQEVVSVGLGWAKDGRRIDLAYAIGIFDGGRNVTDNNNSLYDGTYKFNSQLIAISYGGSF